MRLIEIGIHASVVVTIDWRGADSLSMAKLERRCFCMPATRWPTWCMGFSPGYYSNWEVCFRMMRFWGMCHLQGNVMKADFWDTDSPYHYVRIMEFEEHDVLVVGGEDHPTGERGCFFPNMPFQFCRSPLKLSSGQRCRT